MKNMTKYEIAVGIVHIVCAVVVVASCALGTYVASAGTVI